MPSATAAGCAAATRTAACWTATAIWQRNYLSLLAQRDLPVWGLPAPTRTIDRLLHMLAAVQGRKWNASPIGKSLALSYHTVNGYLDYLEGAFLVRRLPAYHANIRKRLVKRPKVFWRDMGLLHALLTVEDEEALLRQAWVGASREGFVIDQTLAALRHADRALTGIPHAHGRPAGNRSADRSGSAAMGAGSQADYSAAPGACRSAERERGPGGGGTPFPRVSAVRLRGKRHLGRVRSRRARRVRAQRP